MIHFLQGKGAMGAREWKLAALLPRLPVPLLGVLIAVSSVQASCTGNVDESADTPVVDGGHHSDFDVALFGDGHVSGSDAPFDSPSEDSPEDRADGMSYGDGYGKDASGCTPGTRQCSGSGVQTCGSNGEWGAIVACGGTTPSCSDGFCASVTGTSCQPGGAGLTNCGASGESCCTSLEVTGGTYDRTYASPGDGGTGEADPATVSGFRLDKYEVTVGRFRQFVTAWNNGTGYTPPAGSGKHTHLNGGLGLANSGAAGTYEGGWNSADDANIVATDANLTCDPSSSTWTPSPGAHEDLPINCTSWYQAYAFCIWDGGFLPSEAEWEYAAAGGSELREYPWGNVDPGSGNELAIFDCYYPSHSPICSDKNVAPVGTAAKGGGLWGQLDLAGSVWEWSLDGFTPYVDPCADCAYVDPGTDKVLRGGNFIDPATDLLNTYRNHASPGSTYFLGFRCARTP
jgi:sulfatase modifying factor 1